MTRLDRMLDLASRGGVDAVALVPSTQLQYVSGMHYHAGERLAVALFHVDGRCSIVLPEMDAARTAKECDLPFKIYPWNDTQPAQAAMAQLMAELNLVGKRVAVQGTVMRVFELLALQQAGVKETPDGELMFSELRVCKDKAELAILKQAAETIDLSLENLLPQLRAGLTERQVASLWLREILDLGAEGAAFDFIIASGPNAASPHHATGNRVLQTGDLVILDGGARHRGYNSDITRTVAIGKPSETSRRIYDLVFAANTAGRAAAKPGITGLELDAHTRKVIEAAGFGPQFMHRTGHGLGMDIHEPPYIASYNPHALPIGSVFTIEPGIYLAGETGVRIEDDVVMTEKGGVSLTAFPRELMELS